MLPITFLARKVNTHRALALGYRHVARDFLALGDMQQYRECRAKALQQGQQALVLEAVIRREADKTLAHAQTLNLPVAIANL